MREDIIAVDLPAHDQICAWFPHWFFSIDDRAYTVFFHAQLPPDEAVLFLGQWPITLPATYIAWVIAWMLNTPPENHSLLWISVIHSRRAPNNSSSYIAVTREAASQLLYYTHCVRFFPADENQHKLVMRMALTLDAKEFLSHHQKYSYFFPLPSASLSFETPEMNASFPSYAFFNANAPVVAAIECYTLPANSEFVTSIMTDLDRLIDTINAPSNKNHHAIKDQLFSMLCKEPWDDDICAQSQSYLYFITTLSKIAEAFNENENIGILHTQLRALRSKVKIDEDEVSMHRSPSPR